MANAETGSQGALDLAVEELYRIEHRSGWGRVQAIAEVLERYRPPRDVVGDRALSLRRLAEHPRCPLSKSQLRDALEAHRVYLCESVVRDSEFITPSHAAAVSSLDPPLRSQVLHNAEESRWSVRELVERVRDLRRRHGEKRGRPPTSSAEKAITRLDNAILCLDEARALLEVEEIDHEVRATLSQMLAKVRETEGMIADLLRLVDRFGPQSSSGRPAPLSDRPLQVRRSA